MIIGRVWNIFVSENQLENVKLRENLEILSKTYSRELLFCAVFQYQVSIYVIGMMENLLKNKSGLSEEEIRGVKVELRYWDVKPSFNREGLAGMGSEGHGTAAVIQVTMGSNFSTMEFTLMQEVINGIRMKPVRADNYMTLR